MVGKVRAPPRWRCPYPNPQALKHGINTWQKGIKVASGSKAANQITSNREIILDYPGEPKVTQGP